MIIVMQTFDFCKNLIISKINSILHLVNADFIKFTFI
ncbi:hypothetical protein SAMN05444274_106153 [Mariniphaga anaerophila]|uniref:Uncharacterized protein n=1 Tax=Mariniphaga anaerophila TaxID=1484053 RepID=A0A1M5CJM4_9BACT|nr:hypothetical protein SAMN05444274_106153 [Mariniphaga anaerophila]